MQLVYRAASYTFQPTAPALPPVTLTALHTLLYRGKVYHYRKSAGSSAAISRTLNWRFSSICDPQNVTLKAAHA